MTETLVLTDPTTGAEYKQIALHHEPVKPRADYLTDDWIEGLPHAQHALALALRKNGMSGLARCVPDMKPGEIEARLWQMLHTLPPGASKQTADEIELCRFVARRIRKPLHDWDDFLANFFVAVTR